MQAQFYALNSDFLPLMTIAMTGHKVWMTKEINKNVKQVYFFAKNSSQRLSGMDRWIDKSGIFNQKYSYNKMENLCENHN